MSRSEFQKNRQADLIMGLRSPHLLAAVVVALVGLPLQAQASEMIAEANDESVDEAIASQPLLAPSDQASVPTAEEPENEPAAEAARLIDVSTHPTLQPATAQAATTVEEWVAQIEASLVQVIDVRVEDTETGLQIVLETAEGELAAPTTQTAGNALIADIPNAVLALPEGDSFEQFAPAEGIALVSVTNEPGEQVRVAITGTDAPPVAEVTATGLAVTLGEVVAGAGDDAIQVVVTGAENDDYFVPNASSATRTDTPIRDIPQSIQVVPQRVLEDRVITNDVEPLRTVSGITPGLSSAFRTAGFISIRGFDGGANVLRNGTRQLRRATQDELTNLERIEVIKGPASVLYGQGGIGGTINLVTKQPLRDPFYEVSLLAGSFDLYRPSVDISGPLNESETLAYRFNAAYQDAGNFYDFGRDDRWFYAPVINWQISPNTELTFDVKVSRRELRGGGIFGLPAEGTVLPNPNGELPLNRYTGEPDDVSTRIFDVGIGYDLTHQFDEDWSLRNTLRYGYSEATGVGALPGSLEPDGRTLNRSFYEPTNNENAINDNFITTADVIGNFSTGSIEHELLFGAEYSRQGEGVNITFRSLAPLDIFNPVYGATPGDVTRTFESSFSLDTVGIYLQNQITFADNLKMLLGGRIDFLDQRTVSGGSTTSLSETAFSPRIGIVYQPVEPVSLYASYSRSFEPVGGSDFEGNAFVPERGTQYEIGIKTELNERLSATLALFDLTLSNVETADPNNPTFSIQTGEQNSRGIELDISGEILPGWNIAAGYAYIDARITEDNSLDEGNRLNNAPEHTLGLWTSYEVQEGILEGLGAGLGLFYVGERQGDLANSFTVPSYLRTDASVFYRRNNFRGTLSIKNLFDIDYFESAQNRNRVFSGEPLTLQGSISWQF
mgnify:CR=1 FL=1